MGLTLRQQRNGVLRPHWYGVFTDSGKRKVVNLNVPIRGTPPASMSLRDTGDEEFEESRKTAKEKLEEHAEDAAHKGRSEHLTERLIESKTGRKVQYARIADLPARWRGMGRKVRACESHLAHCDGYFRRFVDFMQKQHPKAVYLYEVTPEDATIFVDQQQANLAPATAQYRIRLLAKSMSRFLPVGAVNPFAEFVGSRMNVAGAVVHRQPFTRDELQALLACARSDSFMYPLIVTAACTGMRRGDVCGLRWSAVDLAGGMLTVKTSKTGKKAEIPIFAPLREVLEERKGAGGEFVFPEAARMLRGCPQGLSWRFKRLVAASMDDGVSVDPAPRVTPGEIEAEGLAAVTDRMPVGSRRDRILDTFQRYCGGMSVRRIERETGSARATVSADLHAVQDLLGKPFLPARQGGSLVAAVARLTRVSRVRGQRAASVRDWHALRTTYVTLALSAGVPVELVRRVTGHATVDIVLENYFRPDREQFKAALVDVMPAVLTGDKPVQVPSPENELQELANKLANKTATKADRTRFRVLAAAV